MMLLWRVRYLDSRDKLFKDRDLWLDTDKLDPADKAAVEACHDLKDMGGNREMVRYRHLFREHKYSENDLKDPFAGHCSMSSFCLPDYFEDESGEELTPKRMAFILTGNPNAYMFPPGTKKHDIEFILAPRSDLDLLRIRIPQVDLNALAYFSRDVRELRASSLLAEGPGKITGAGWMEPVAQTSVSEEEIRAFVTVFRRLYMANEPGNFPKAAEAFARAVRGHPVGRWVQGVAGEYDRELNSLPNMILFVEKDRVAFKRKRLIDVFLNTQYAHQGDEKRERQYAECLAQVSGRREVLFWLFLTSIWECALLIVKAGVQIAPFTQEYCKCHNLTPGAVRPAAEYVAMGQLEKRHDREARILGQKAEELAMTLWKNARCPAGGPTQFLCQAREQLRAAMGGTDVLGDSG